MHLLIARENLHVIEDVVSALAAGFGGSVGVRCGGKVQLFEQGGGDVWGGSAGGGAEGDGWVGGFCGE